MSGGLGQGADGSRHKCHPAQGTHSKKGLPNEDAWPIAVTPFRTSRQSASSGRGVQFQLRHGVLQSNPFFRNQGEEFDTDAARAVPSTVLETSSGETPSGGRGFATRGW